MDRVHRELFGEQIERIAVHPSHAWRGEKGAGKYEDLPGFCKSPIIRGNRRARLHPHARPYVGAEAQEDDGEPFEEKMKRLVA